MVTLDLSGLDVRSQSPSPDSILARLPERIAALIETGDGCWQYRGKIGSYGYAYITFGGRWVGLHCLAFELANGRRAAGVVDHTCHNIDPDCLGGVTCLHRSCLNPAHLEDVSRGENVLRGKGLCAANLAKTHCPQGHAYSPENTYHWPTGKRKCRACNRIAEAAKRRRRFSLAQS